jgi:hypothetical protein
MKLLEFFGKNIDVHKNVANSRDDKNIGDDLFWYIVDHDKLHKDFFHPVAKKIREAHKNNNKDKERNTMEFMPMVKKGCLEYYHHHKMPGTPAQIFSKELRKDMCERLYDHYCEDILKDKYKLG